MPSFAHKQLIDRIARLDEVPDDSAAFANWIKAGGHLSLLRDNAIEDELIVFASGDYTFVHAAVVPNEKLYPIDHDDLLGWTCNPFSTVASYASGGDRKGIWIDRRMFSASSKTLADGRQLVFGRTFEGWTGDDRTYFEVLQEYAHVAGIHWRPEHRAYCRFDQHGDIDHIVSVTAKDNFSGITLVSFRRGPLENYLAASDSALIRMFDFTLLRRKSFSGWPDGPEKVFKESSDFFYRQKIAPGHAAYTRGLQIIRPTRPQSEIFSSMWDDWTGQGNKQYVEFIAHDWRNRRVTKISTNPAATTNYFDAKENTLPFETSPAFFRPEVLLKYKGDHDKYIVGPREIHCRAAWTLRGYDVNQAGQIHAYICYLRDLPHSEQLHWASYNEVPKAGISERAFVNDFKGEFSYHLDPLQKVLSIIRHWVDKDVNWWKLRDKTLLERISTPRTASRDEWGEAFMDLAKLIIEGFDVKAIRQKLREESLTFDNADGSLALIEKLLCEQDESAEVQRLAGLRIVQLIRTKVKGHSSGSDANELAQGAIKQHETFAAHFDYICSIVADELERIERLFT